MTRFSNSGRTTLLIFGDVIAYLFSLILTLTVRYSTIPGRGLLFTHLGPFSLLFVIFIIVGLSIGLYDKRAAFVRSRVEVQLLQLQIINVLIGIAFFYFAPLAIAPKANLFIYFIISTALLYVWRGFMFPILVSGRPQRAIIVGVGEEVDDLFLEINGTGKYGITFMAKITPTSNPEETSALIQAAVTNSKPSILVADLRNNNVEAAMRYMYSLIFSGIQVVDVTTLYETVFDRIPLSLVGERWLVENSAMALGQSRIYDSLKRTMDIVLGTIAGIVSLIFYPFVYIGIKLEDRGPLFVVQQRVGKNGKLIKLVKFRSMTADDGGKYDANGGKTKHVVTRVGKIIRLTRIDELPQLWSVILGHQSLIGPRPELPALVDIYEKEVPYYNARHLIKPGLSGWAQIRHEAHPHHAVAIDDTRDKLSYDLYYVKNRSFLLDVKIALQTLGAMISRQGV